MKVGLSLLVLLSVAACGRDPASSVAKTAGSPAAQSGGSGTESVSAVVEGGSSRAVTLRFALQERPRVGATSHLQLEFAAAAPQPGATFRVEGEELGFDASGNRQVLDLAEAGRSVTQTVSFTPRSPGLAQATVHVQPASAEAPEIVYTVPVLVEPAAP